tara:strand:+ start:225 stop:431 length:207 start_codon:yes stop_codon:yes gene_type:complete
MTGNTNGKKYIKITVTLLSISLLIYLGDIFYDMKSGDAALTKCGEGNVEAVSTKGFYKREISCSSDNQ